MAHLNFSKFTMISNDGKKAILRHPAGHEFHISVKNLHPGNREELKKLPMYKGGKAMSQSNPKLEESKKSPSDHEAVSDKYRLPPEPNSQRAGPYGKELLSKGGPVVEPQKLYDGGNPLPPLPDSMINPHPGQNFQQNQGTTPEDATTSFMDPTPVAPSNLPPGSNGTTIPDTSNATDPQLAAQGVQSALAQSPQAPPSQPQQQSGLPQPGDYASQLQGAIKGQQQGITNEGKALSAEGKAKANAVQSGINAQDEIAHHIDAVTDYHNTEIQSVVDDIKAGHIDPNRYLSSMDTTSKIGTGIGLILGGIGAGLTHGPNMALDFLNKQIDRDIEGQKADLGRKENLVSLYSKQLGNERDGAIMASNVLAKITADKLLQAGEQSQDPIVKARAQQASNALLASKLPELQSMNMTQGLINASKQMSSDPQTNDAKMQNILGYMRVAKPDMAKEMESRYVPGLGMASVPIPEKDRTELATKSTGLKMAQDLRGWAQTNAGAMNPATVNEGKAKATAMLNYYRTATDQGVIKPSELEFDAKIVDSDPTKFFNKFRVDPKYKVLEDSMTKDLNTKRQQYGLPQVKNTSEQSSKAPASSGSPQIIVNKSTSQRMQLVNGKYQPI